MTKEKKIQFAIHLFIVLSTFTIALFGIFNGASEGQVGTNIRGLAYFKPFTIDSNVYLGVCSLLFCIFLILEWKGKIQKLPGWLYTVFFTAVVSVSLTMITVVVFLFPSLWMKYGLLSALSLFWLDMFFFHVLNPILSIVIFFMTKEEKKYTWMANLLAVIPMFIYSIVYLINVVMLETWSDFYGFTFGGHIVIVPFVMIIMYLVTYGIGAILIGIQKKYRKEELSHD